MFSVKYKIISFAGNNIQKKSIKFYMQNKEKNSDSLIIQTVGK